MINWIKASRWTWSTPRQSVPLEKKKSEFGVFFDRVFDALIRMLANLMIGCYRNKLNLGALA